MRIPTEPIGSIPRPLYLVDALKAVSNGSITPAELSAITHRALTETIKAFESTGSPVITDGEQSKPSFATYPIHGASNLSHDGVVIPFADGHTRQLPVLTAGPFRYRTFADQYLREALALTKLPVKQAVISPSVISLLYPGNGIPDYPREQFFADLLDEAEKDIRRCLDGGAHSVQIDFTEARLAIKLDPSKALLKAFIDMNNMVLSRFNANERQNIGIHTCPGGDHDSTHSADVDYGELLPELFQLEAGNFYLEYAAEGNKSDVLRAIKASMKPSQRVFLGVTNVIDPRIETPREICDLLLAAAAVIPADQIGSCDDCGFSPFSDDTSTGRDIAFAKIVSRLEGTALAEGRV